MTNFIDIKEFTSLIVSSRLTPNQLFICFMLYEKDVGSAMLYTEKMGLFAREDLKTLIDKDFILSTNEGQYDFLNLYVTPKFTNLIVINEEEQGEEFWNEFPNWIMLGEKKVPAKAIGKEEVISEYFKAIKGSIPVHNEVMSKLKAWKKANRGYAGMNIKNFIRSRHWEALTDDNYRPETTEI